ncbi:hypothetical protein EPUL_002042, partial [Erysiphe pulchra]
NHQRFQLRRAVFRAAASAPSSVLNIRPVNKTSPLLSLIISPLLPSVNIIGRFNSDYSGDRGRGFGENRGSDFLQDNDRSNFGNSRDSSFTRDRPFSPPADLTPNPNIYVGNLVFHVTEDDLKKEFSSFGPIKNAIIAVDSRGLSKGFGYVEFESTEQAQAAIAAKNQMVFEGRRLIVNYQAKTRRSTKENPPSKTLFVGNIAFEMTDAELNKLFREVRNCSDIRVAVDRRTGQPRGFAHAEFLTVEDATAAKELLADREIHGRKLRLDYSTGPSRTNN